LREDQKAKLVEGGKREDWPFNFQEKDNVSIIIRGTKRPWACIFFGQGKEKKDLIP